ncbi:hypothetical protein C8R47DRAFT_1072809 [Mycena vitilis]|nr:hypothetical protein C8R47DRAFT_1072809 [Mycena vitilis]
MSKSQQEGVFFTFGLVNLSQAQKPYCAPTYFKHIFEHLQSDKTIDIRIQIYLDTVIEAQPSLITERLSRTSSATMLRAPAERAVLLLTNNHGEFRSGISARTYLTPHQHPDEVFLSS